jgi:hypothetical protein
MTISSYCRAKYHELEWKVWCFGIRMGKLASSSPKFRSRAWYIVPAVILGAIAFNGISSADLNYFASGYLALLIAQLGVLGIYVIINRLKLNQAKQKSHSD